MKVFCVKLNSKDEFLSIRKVHFTESNREKVRKHVKLERSSDYVWFEDENPPSEVVGKITSFLESQHEAFGDQDP